MANGGWDGPQEAIRGLRERMERSEEDSREIWREQGRVQERLAREETRGEKEQKAIDSLTAKVDGLGKLAWGILAAVVLLLLGVIGNLAILLQQGGTP
jgi:hypothetical protein